MMAAVLSTRFSNLLSFLSTENESYQLDRRDEFDITDVCYSAKEENQERQLNGDIADVLTSIRQLLMKYKMYTKSNETPVVSGGLQQYIINKLKRRGASEKTLTQRLKALYLKDEQVTLNIGSEEGEMSMFDCLPVDVKLHIFAHVDARSLCQACKVSQGWNQLLWDDLLWRQRLRWDMLTWSQVSHVTNPQVYMEAASDFTFKEIYLRCSPEVLVRQREENSAFHQVSSVLKYLMPKKAPKVALFGPGIESSTSIIVRKMLYDDHSPFTRVALFPGQFDGMGSGMTLQLQSPSIHTFHLTVLYSSSKSERERANQPGGNSRLARNCMLNQQQSAEGEEREGEEARYELKPALQQLCHTLNAFIFVVDVSGTKEAVADGKTELKTMVQERWASPQVPVLVLSCVPTATSPRVPAVEVVQALELSTFSRPWMVMDCVADTLDSVDKGVRWIIEMCQRK